jgi:outer membrane protein W
MKAITLLFFILITANVFAQSEKINHLEIGASALFWTPTAEHMRAKNTLMKLTNPNYYSSPDASVNGYGPCIAPKIHINYYFKNYLGISFGFNYLSIENHLEFPKPSSIAIDTSKFYNEAKIFNLQLGYAGQTNDFGRIHIYYGAGINYTPSYTLNLNMEYGDEFPSYEDNSWAFGAYINAGMQVKIVKQLYFIMGFEYSYIPHTLSYKSSIDSMVDIETNLGGIAGQIGLSYKLLNY